MRSNPGSCPDFVRLPLLLSLWLFLMWLDQSSGISCCCCIGCFRAQAAPCNSWAAFPALHAWLLPESVASLGIGPSSPARGVSPERTATQSPAHGRVWQRRVTLPWKEEEEEEEEKREESGPQKPGSSLAGGATSPLQAQHHHHGEMLSKEELVTMVSSAGWARNGQRDLLNLGLSLLPAC